MKRGDTIEVEVEDEEKELLGKEAATRYRALVARGIYLPQDRSDMAYAVKELSRGMARPTHESGQKKRQAQKGLATNKNQNRTTENHNLVLACKLREAELPAMGSQCFPLGGTTLSYRFTSNG